MQQYDQLLPSQGKPQRTNVEGALKYKGDRLKPAARSRPSHVRAESFNSTASSAKHLFVFGAASAFVHWRDRFNFPPTFDSSSITLNSSAGPSRPACFLLLFRRREEDLPAASARTAPSPAASPPAGAADVSAPSLPPAPANMAAAAPPDPRLLLAVLLLLPPPGPLCAAGPELSRRFTERKRCADPECSSECRAGGAGGGGPFFSFALGRKTHPRGGRRFWECRAVRVRSPTGCVSMSSSGGGLSVLSARVGSSVGVGMGQSRSEWDAFRTTPRAPALAELVLRGKFQSTSALFLLCCPGILYALDSVSLIRYEASFSPSYLILIISLVELFSDVILKCFIKHSIGELTFYLRSDIFCYIFISRPEIHPCERGKILFSAN